MEDRLETLGTLLDEDLPVLVYHGNFDLVLPVAGISDAIHNIQWKNRLRWHTASNELYHIIDPEDGFQELMGYKQSGGGLSFVVVRNAGHMVPIDKPKWALKILTDFINKD